MLIIGVVAGEDSGDRLGAELIVALRQLMPSARFVGIAGPQMQAVGCESWFDMAELSRMGLFEIVSHLPRLLAIRRRVRQHFTQLRPDLFIGIDAPDFNLSLALALKRQGIPTVQYVCPSVWAWRPKRITKIAQATNLVLALLPFEKSFCERFHVACRFVGHPAADSMPLVPDVAGVRARLDILPSALCLALLPGSRSAEVMRLAVPFLKTVRLLMHSYPHLITLVPLANEVQRQQFNAIHARVAPEVPLRVLAEDARSALTAADVALVASGTATLEAMLAKCPMVVAYRLHPLTFWLAKKLVKIAAISLPNLLAGQPLVSELLQQEATPERLATALMSLLAGDNSALKQRFTEMHQQIRCQASQQAAEAVLQLLA